MLAGLPAAAASARYGAVHVGMPPWAKALQRPKAVGPVASGPSAVSEGSDDSVGVGDAVSVGSVDSVGDAVLVGSEVSVGSEV
jgi:hypothetical protein